MSGQLLACSLRALACAKRLQDELRKMTRKHCRRGRRWPSRSNFSTDARRGTRSAMTINGWCDGVSTHEACDLGSFC